MIIGVTGGIASGKSVVCKILEKYGFISIDADAVGHEVLKVPEVIDEITRVFGTDILSNDEEQKDSATIDRKKLGKIVFSDNKKLNLLENITHPEISRQIRGMINKNDKMNYVIEAIEIVNSGLVKICDELWIVKADPEIQLKRLMENRHMTYEDACARLNTQKDHDWDESSADRIINSSGTLESVEEQVRSALKI